MTSAVIRDTLANLPVPPGRHVAVIGPYVYGLGPDAVTAYENARKANGRRKLTAFIVYHVHPETSVDGLVFTYPQGPCDDPGAHRPVEMWRLLPLKRHRS